MTHRRDAENAEAAQRRTLVIGYGNPLRGDDAVGYLAAEALLCDASASLRCKALHQLTPELAADLAETDLAIFIDAACDNERGEVACRQVLPQSAAPGGFTHQLTPEVLLGLTRQLYGTCPEAVLFSVGADSFGYGDALSEPVRAALPGLLERVRAAIIIPDSRRGNE
jgi:hydrogenase maturation protease